MSVSTLVKDCSGGRPFASATPRVSVIICTKDRPAELAVCLDSLARQMTQPAEVIVVDASTVATEREVSDFRSKVGPECNVKLLRASPALTRQRNIGVHAASGSVLLFLDDDTVLATDYLREIAAVYENDPESRIGGVGGATISDPTHTEPWLRRVFKRVFLLSSIGFGRLKRSGHPAWVFSPREPLKVEFLSGCNMSYRREVFDYLKFDERLTGYALGEDLHFSYAVSRRWQLVLTPYARLEHRDAAGGRPSTRDRAEMGVLHHLLFFREQVARSPLDWLCYFWSLLGGLLLTLRHPGEGRLTGVLLGYRRVAGALISRRTSIDASSLPSRTSMWRNAASTDGRAEDDLFRT